MRKNVCIYRVVSLHSIANATLTWKGVDEMSEEVWMCSCCRALDCRLYTPTVDDYKQICTLSTLNCFAEEVKVLDMEIEDRTLRVVFALRKRLKKLTLNINEKLKNKTQIQCPPCEIHTEQAAAVFLEALNSVLQYQCSADPMDT
ncbi:interleukin 15, like isoform X6 [Clupea harengus]|uniref:Interleukin n=1 Tax=Clupea harengus TaxID=7950 RepID=A0A6P8G118_CLUHA|nr:interleukin 15, like isoform X6 [Clupea harengus]